MKGTKNLELPKKIKDGDMHLNKSAAKEDFYDQLGQEEDIDPEDISKMKTPNASTLNEELPGNDLDVPGAELDDDDEMIGSEDEENNYYSLGGEYSDNFDEGRD